MNNNLWKELAEQADAYAYAKIGMSFDYHPDWHGVRDEKFAELIVRECVSVALEQKKWVENQKVFNPLDEQWNRARIQQSQHIVDKIKEHFGVEQ